MAPTVIVTGASRGLGAAAARQLAPLGANLVLSARSRDALEAQAADLQASGCQAAVVAGDISQRDVVEQLVDVALQRFGTLDAVINNAGVLQPVAFLADADTEDWQHNLAVNLLGPFLLTRMALPHLRRQRGHVVNVSSGAALRPIAGWSAYSVAKAALNQLTAALALEEPDITAIALRPGVVDTAMQAVIRDEGAAGMEPEQHAHFVTYHRQGDLLPPDRPGLAMAVLALHAPQAWSGEFIAWDEPRVQELVRRYAAA